MNPSDFQLDRNDVLPKLIPEPGKYLIIAGLAGTARDVAHLCGVESSHFYAMAGAMGGAVSIGLGLALAQPEKRVLVCTGDGELLMNAGALATVASAAPQNLTIVCIDNGEHGETGGQPGHTSKRTRLATLAAGAGIASVMTVSKPDELLSARDFLADGIGPKFLWVRVMPGPPADYKRNWDLIECRLRFRRANVAAN